MSDKGAHYYRCDFQVHTPRDLNWTEAERVTDVSRQSLVQLKTELDKHTYLRDRYIVFPHVGEDGQFSLIRN